MTAVTLAQFIIGDGQVSLGSHIVKPNAKKVRQLSAGDRSRVKVRKLSNQLFSRQQCHNAVDLVVDVYMLKMAENNHVGNGNGSEKR